MVHHTMKVHPVPPSISWSTIQVLWDSTTTIHWINRQRGVESWTLCLEVIHMC